MRTLTRLRNIRNAFLGAAAGLVLGPFALTGKLYAEVELSLLEQEHGIKLSDPETIANIKLAAVAMTPITLFFGLFYGPIRGAILAYQLGIKNMFKEMFTYDAKISIEQAKLIPEDELLFNSYRIFHRQGLFSSEQKPKESKFLEENKLLQEQYLKIQLMKKGSCEAGSPLSRLPPEMIREISSHLLEVPAEKKTKALNRWFRTDAQEPKQSVLRRVFSRR